MRKHKKLMILVILFIILLTGCTTKYEQKDVYRYVKKKYKLKNVKVSKERVDITGKDDYVDHIWEITADDITFHVKDDYGWESALFTNRLKDDFRYALLKKFFNSNILPHFILDEKNEERLYLNELIGKFASKEELQQLYVELEKFKTYIAEKGYDVSPSFSYHLIPQSPIHSDKTLAFFIYDADTTGNSTNITDDVVKEAMTRYILAYTDYHFSDIYDKFTEDEIKEAVSNSYYRLTIVRDNDTYLYDDLCASGLDEVSFGTMYEILKREGFDVKGTNEHYTFIDVNQNTYEIAYPSDNIISLGPVLNEKTHSYLLKNGKLIEHEYRYGFGINEIEKIFGLKLHIVSSK